MTEDQVILVDEADRPIGIAGKAEAHRRALLHRAFSVFLRDDGGRLLLQRRADGKYHSAGRWANACCGHPRPGEDTANAAIRRLREELGVEMQSGLETKGTFVYRADVGNGLVEHELDHVFSGVLRETPTPDPAEISQLRWIAPTELSADLLRYPTHYAAWLGDALRLALT